MNISAIETFLSVIQTGNLNKAAERLNVTESTVTARLDALENILGQKLLMRSRRGAQMTKAGFAFRASAELIVQSWEQGRARVTLPKGFSGVFSLACEFDLWQGLGKPWMAEIKLNHPDVAAEVWSGSIGQARDWLQSGMVDASLASEPIASAGLSTRLFATDTIIQVSDTQRDVQDWDETYIYVDHGPDVRRQHSEAWPGDETAYMTISGVDWALDYLITHGGSAYLPQRLIERHLQAGTLHPINGSPHFEKTLYLSWRESATNPFPWLNEE